MRRLAAALPAAVLLAAVVLAAGAGGAAGPERGFRGCLAVRGERVLAAENAGRLFTPGSVQKLLVCAAALHYLGPEYRVTTTVHGAGARNGGVLAGDLVVAAAGDPTWNARFFAADPRAPIRALARQLRERGLRRVAGDLVIDVGRFPGRGVPPSRPPAEFAYAYGAPTSALAVDESSVAVEIAPGRRPGDPGTVRPLGEAVRIEWDNRIRTVGRERHDRGTVDFLPVWERLAVIVRGEYPVSEPPYRTDVSVPQPDLFAAEVLREVWHQEGVEIAGRIRLEAMPSGEVLPSGAVPPSGEVLAVLRSPPLAELLPPILGDSHNWYAEMLLRQLALAVHGEARDDEGLDLVEKLLTEEVGLAEDAFVLDDASGLSPYDLLSPEAVVGLLRYVRRQPWRDLFMASLASPGRGTLKGWGRLPPLAAKTGTIRHSLALAGYLEPGGREPVVFACFLNHRGEERTELRAEMTAWLQRWVD